MMFSEYRMFGDSKAKVAGLRHLYVHYLGEPPATGEIELYRPYSNRECLHCHSGARSYEEVHEGDLEALAANELSCLECHDVVHEVDRLDEVEMWTRSDRTGGGEGD